MPKIMSPYRTTHAWESDTSAIAYHCSLKFASTDIQAHAWFPLSGKISWESSPYLEIWPPLIATVSLYPTHSPTAMNDGGMMAILQEDHEIFKNLNSHCEDVKKAVIALSGKKKGKNGTEKETDHQMTKTSKYHFVLVC